jgi:malonate-semialdehyde dehydrogenase (acetylating)/methylmalonate-semialdehyde dehydrogenase
MTDHGHFYAGRDVAGTSGRTGDLFEPATGERLGSVALANAAEVGAATAAATRGFAAWSQVTPTRRARILARFLRLVEERSDSIGTLLAREHGKTLPDAKAEIQRGLEVIEFAIGIPHLLKGTFSDQVATGMDSYAFRQPLGVIAGISPFNFPAMIPMWMFGVAIAAGNCVVLKPSERDPGVPLQLARIMLEAGAPAGVLSVVNGDKQAVDALIADPLVQAISFVGSSAIAESIYASAAAAGKRVQALGGAKNHLIVMPDADLDVAVDNLIGAAYGSAGERCMAVSVAVPVGEETAERLVAALRSRVAALRIGPSLSPEADFGPLISGPHRERVVGFVERAVAAGADLVVDGRGVQVPGHPGGYYLGGCLFDRVTPAMEIWREEVFGPVLSVVRVAGLEEALQLADSHQYGNGVALFTRSGRLARDFVRRVQVGMVGVNVPLPVPLASYSFGGWKRSAYGGFHQHGVEGLNFCTKLKNVMVRWPEEPEGAVFAMPTPG